MTKKHNDDLDIQVTYEPDPERMLKALRVVLRQPDRQRADDKTTDAAMDRYEGEA